LFLEKEMAILLGTSSDKVMEINPNVILKGALVTIQKDLNEIQQNIGQFVDAIRELTLESHTQVYIANSAPQVRGGFMQLAPSFALFVVLGAILGLFLGVFVALIRSALLKNK
jgi:LPS O-antigen subunit length determinant protein (WzzB/FepE family)